MKQDEKTTATTVWMSGRVDNGIVEALRRELQRKDGPELVSAVMRLGQLGIRAASAVDDLIYTLENGGGSTVHWAAAHALGLIGPGARAAVPALQRAISLDPSPDVRVEAEYAIGLIRRSGSPHL